MKIVATKWPVCDLTRSTSQTCNQPTLIFVSYILHPVSSITMQSSNGTIIKCKIRILALSRCWPWWSPSSNYFLNKWSLMLMHFSHFSDAKKKSRVTKSNLVTNHLVTWPHWSKKRLVQKSEKNGGVTEMVTVLTRLMF